MPRKEIRDRYIANNICANCGSVPVEQNTLMCEKCRQKHIYNSKLEYIKRANTNRCVKCGRDITEGTTTKTCLNCQEGMSIYYAWYNRVK